MNKLEIINLTKKYGNKTALNNFTYTFENGVYGLIGPNGADGSALLKDKFIRKNRQQVLHGKMVCNQQRG